MIDLSADRVNAFDSMHVNSEFVSNKIDENDLQSKKQNEHDEE
jgi:hypothetical protein